MSQPRTSATNRIATAMMTACLLATTIVPIAFATHNSGPAPALDILDLDETSPGGGNVADPNASSNAPLDWASLFGCANPPVTSAATFCANPTPISQANLVRATFGRDYNGAGPGSGGGTDSSDNSIFATKAADGENPEGGWDCTDANNVLGKDDIMNAYAAAFIDEENHLILFVGVETDREVGNAFVGFWIFMNPIACDPDGTGLFTGNHTNGDLLLLGNITPSAGALVRAYKWNASVSGNLQPVDLDSTVAGLQNGLNCNEPTNPSDDHACGMYNAGNMETPWGPRTGNYSQAGASTGGYVAPNGFLEVGVDLTLALGLPTFPQPGSIPCFGTFIAETRASDSISANLHDYVSRPFGTCRPDLTIEKTPDAGTYAVGDSFDWKLFVNNTGQGIAENVWVNDSIPSGFTIGTPTTTQGTCSVIGQGVTCEIGAMDSGDAVVVTIPVTANGAQCGLIINTGRVASSNTNPSSNEEAASLGDNVDTGQVNVNCPDVTISKTAADDSVNAGDAIAFNITTTNNGPGVAANVQVSDTLPTITGSWAENSDECSIAAGVLSCTYATMPAGSIRSVTISSTATTSDCGDIDNTGTVTANVDTNLLNNSASDSITVACPDVSIAKTAASDPVTAGDAVSFNITTTNNGPGIATGVSVSDTLPALTGGWTENSDECSITANVLSCTYPSMADGSTRSVTVSGTSAVTDCGTLPNTATVSATGDTNANNNEASDSITVNCPDVTITKTAAADPVSAGDAVSFNITTTNNGPGTISNVVVTDTLPVLTGGWTENSDECSIAANVLSCNYPSIASGASRSVTVSGSTTTADCTTLPNTASVTGDGDTNANNNEASDSITVNCPDVTITKTAASDTVSAGDALSFNVTTTNNGPGVATDVTISDPLPALTGGWTENSDECSITANVLSCTYPSMTSGSSRSVTVSGTASTADCGDLDNTATVSAPGDADTTNNVSSDSITVNCPDVTITKTAASDTVSAGDALSFNVTTTNNGPGTATNVMVSDPLPALDGGWAENSDECSITSNVLSCTYPSMTSGSTRSVTVSGTASTADCGALENTATVWATGDSDITNNQSTDTITVNCPDVTISKTAADDSVNAGDAVSFNVTTTNNGPGVATDVTVSDTLPAITGGWTENSDECSIAANVLSCTYPSMTDGSTRSVTVSGTAGAADCGDLDNTATVSARGDSDLTNNSASDSIEVLCASIQIVKTADADPVNAGDAIGFELNVSNTGAGDAYGVTVTDTLPTDAGLSWSIDGGSAAGACAITAGVLSCDLGTLLAGAWATVHVTSPTTADTCGTVSNTGNVTTTNDGTDESTDTVTVLCPDVVVLKTAHDDSVSAGDAVGFGLVVTNDGDGTAYDVELNDTLPSGITWTDDSDLCDVVAGVLLCDFGSLESGASAWVNVTGLSAPSDCGDLYNFATVNASNEAATDAANNWDDATITVSCPDVHVAKTADDDSVNAGDGVGFGIVVTNDGDGTAYGVVLNDTLPAGAWTDDSDDCTIAAGALDCAFGDLGAGESAWVNLTSTTTAADCGTIYNFATVGADNEATEDQSDNWDDASITVSCPDVTVAKTAHNETINAGDEIGFGIVVSNAGAGTAYDVELNDTLPAGLTWVDDSDACEIVAGELLCDFGTLATGESASVNVTATTSAVDCGTITNFATVVASNEADADTTNNWDDALVTVDCPDVTVAKTAHNESISAGDEIGFEIVVTSLGPGTAYDVAVNDTLPAGLTWAEDSDACTITGSELLCDFGDLESGATASVNVTADTSAVDCGTITNFVTVRASNEAEADQANNWDDAVVTVDCPDVHIAKTAHDEEVYAPGTVGFEIVVTNGGLGTAYDVAVNDTLPAGFTWTEDSAACDIVAGELLCDFGALEGGAHASVNLTAPADGSVCDPVWNAATVTASNEPTADQSDNWDDAGIYLVCGGDLHGYKFHDQDASGTWNGVETGLAGWLIYLDLNNDSVFDAGEPNTTTGGDGSWNLTGVLAGTYVVREQMQSGWAQTAPTTGYWYVVLAGGAVVNDLNFGNINEHEGTIGFWRNWDRHNTYTQSDINAWVAIIDGDSAWLMPSGATVNTAGIVKVINDATKNCNNKADSLQCAKNKFLAQYLVTRLNVESERKSNATIYDLSTQTAAATYLGLGTSASLGDIFAAIEAKAGTSPSRTEYLRMMSLCDMINNIGA